jgi:hypothetical protein
MNSSAFGLLDPWLSLSPEQAELLLREAHVEISPGHTLHALSLVPIAQSRRADDVLFKLDDGRVAAVHLTWRRSPEPPPWPSSQTYASFDEWSEQVMIPDSKLE